MWPCSSCGPLPLSALRSALGAAPALILTLAEGAVAQILLFVDHVAEFVQLLHHVAEIVAVHVRRRHVQVFHHLLELLQQLARRVLGAVGAMFSSRSSRFLRSCERNTRALRSSGRVSC